MDDTPPKKNFISRQIAKIGTLSQRFRRAASGAYHSSKKAVNDTGNAVSDGISHAGQKITSTAEDAGKLFTDATDLVDEKTLKRVSQLASLGITASTFIPQVRAFVIAFKLIGLGAVLTSDLKKGNSYGRFVKEVQSYTDDALSLIQEKYDRAGLSTIHDLDRVKLAMIVPEESIKELPDDLQKVAHYNYLLMNLMALHDNGLAVPMHALDIVKKSEAHAVTNYSVKDLEDTRNEFETALTDLLETEKTSRFDFTNLLQNSALEIIEFAAGYTKAKDTLKKVFSVVDGAQGLYQAEKMEDGPNYQEKINNFVEQSVEKLIKARAHFNAPSSGPGTNTTLQKPQI